MQILPIPALKDNYVWVIPDQSSKKAVIVDPGEAAPVIKYLDENKLTLAGILITHHHWDHTNGISELLEHYGNIPVIGSHDSKNDMVTVRVNDGDEIKCAHVTCTALTIPGHTLDHTAYYNAEHGFIFTGDTLFSAGCGRIFEGTPVMMYASLEKISSLPDTTKVYCGHEYTRANLEFAMAVEPDNADIKNKNSHLAACTLPSTLGEEKRINPFLRCTQPNVIRAAGQYTKNKLNNPAEVFAVLREWKNNF